MIFMMLYICIFMCFQWLALFWMMVYGPPYYVLHTMEVIRLTSFKHTSKEKMKVVCVVCVCYGIKF